jgi:hypothetical protein
MRTDRSDGDLLAAVGQGEPRGREFDKFREHAAVVEAEFRSALSGVNNLHWRSQMTAGPASQPAADDARAADPVVAAAG